MIGLFRLGYWRRGNVFWRLKQWFEIGGKVASFLNAETASLFPCEFVGVWFQNFRIIFDFFGSGITTPKYTFPLKIHVLPSTRNSKSFHQSRLYVLCNLANNHFQNITGWFTLQGVTDRPFVYRVETIREGGSYCQRQVNVTQDPSKGVCFTCICSFKKPEASNNERQLDLDLGEKYKDVLLGKVPEDWPECPGVDSP